MKITKLMVLPALVAILGFSSAASAQVIGPRVALQFATNGLTNPLSANTSDAVIARLLLDTTGSTEAVRIASLPFNLVVGGGASASTLTNCRVFNESDLSNALNSSSSSTSLFTGVNSISFSNALILQPNTLTTLSLRCNVGSGLGAGNTFTVNMNTNDVVATGASTGLAAAVTIRGAVVVPPVTIPPVVTPGLPTTGAAGQAAQNVAMIAASLLIASLGFSYLRARQS